MPILIVHGVPKNTEKKKLEELIADCQCIISGISELRISGKQVSVFFPPDLVQQGLGEEIIVPMRLLNAWWNQFPRHIAGHRLKARGKNFIGRNGQCSAPPFFIQFIFVLRT